MVRFLIILGALAAWPIVALAQPAQVDDQTAVQIEALNRLRGADLESNTALKAAVLRVLDKTHGTPQFVEIVRNFSLKGHADLLLEYAIKYPAEQSAIEAFRLAVAEKGDPAISTLLASTNAAAVVQLMANTRDKAFEPQLKSLAAKSDKPFPVRQSAVKALGTRRLGKRQNFQCRLFNLRPRCKIQFRGRGEFNVGGQFLGFGEIEKVTGASFGLREGFDR